MPARHCWPATRGRWGLSWPCENGCGWRRSWATRSDGSLVSASPLYCKGNDAGPWLTVKQLGGRVPPCVPLLTPEKEES